MLNSEKDLIFGKNAINEAIRAKRQIDKLYVIKGEKSGSIVEIIAKAKKMGALIKETDKKKLDFMCSNSVHQGVAARVTSHKYATISDIFETAKLKNEEAFIIIADSIEDPHNLGAIIRTAECVGAHGVIIPKHNSAGLSYSVSKSSAGALEYMNIVKVTNISKTIDELKERGIWVFGTDMKGELYTKTDLRGPVAIVTGNEGKGVSQLVKKKCDSIITIPLEGKISSLNVSVATGVIAYEILRQRNGDSILSNI
jgi:23S rRNA (guanosine2251-2'-O)-methyltransferase